MHLHAVISHLVIRIHYLPSPFTKGCMQEVLSPQGLTNVSSPYCIIGTTCNLAKSSGKSHKKN